MYGRELTLSSGNKCPTGHIPMVDSITTGTLYTLQPGHKCLKLKVKVIHLITSGA